MSLISIPEGEELEEKFIATVKETSEFKFVEIYYDAQIKLIEEWLENTFE